MHGVGAEELQYLALITRNLIHNIVTYCMRLFLLGLLALAGLGCQVRPAVTMAPVAEQATPVLLEPAEIAPEPAITTYPNFNSVEDAPYCNDTKRSCERMHSLIWEEGQRKFLPVLVTKNKQQSSIEREWGEFLGRLVPVVRATLQEPVVLEIPDDAMSDDWTYIPTIRPEYIASQLAIKGLNGVPLVYWDTSSGMSGRYIKDYGLYYRSNISSLSAIDEAIYAGAMSEQSFLAWLAFVTR